MARDIVVTTPKGRMEEARSEAEDCKQAGGGWYFRRLDRGILDPDAEISANQSRVFYVEDGFLRGYCLLKRTANHRTVEQITGREWPPGVYAVMDATTWQWIEPVPMRGFQGWQFLPRSIAESVEVVGGWLDPRPVVLNQVQDAAGPLFAEAGS